MKKVSIVFMVAGMSSRFGGKIKQFAKVGVNGETLIEISVNQAIAAGFNEIVFVVGSMTEEPFKDMFGTSFKGVGVKYAKQEFDLESRDKPWGTADALANAFGVVEGPFVVCSGDDLYGEDSFRLLYSHLAKEKTSCALGHTLSSVLPDEGTVNRGIYELDSNNMVKGLEEYFGISKEDLVKYKLKDSDLANMSIFGFQVEVLEVLHKRVESFKRTNAGNRRKECILAEEIGRLIKNGMLMKLYEATDQWLGVTNPEDADFVKKALIKLNEK